MLYERRRSQPCQNQAVVLGSVMEPQQSFNGVRIRSDERYTPYLIWKSRIPKRRPQQHHPCMPRQQMQCVRYAGDCQTRDQSRFAGIVRVGLGIVMC
eukprot:403333063